LGVGGDSVWIGGAGSAFFGGGGLCHWRRNQIIQTLPTPKRIQSTLQSPLVNDVEDRSSWKAQHWLNSWWSFRKNAREWVLKLKLIPSLLQRNGRKQTYTNHFRATICTFRDFHELLKYRWSVPQLRLKSRIVEGRSNAQSNGTNYSGTVLQTVCESPSDSRKT